MALKLNNRADGFGYLYGQYTTPSGERYRVDIMPPKSHWQGDLMPMANPPHETDWVIYCDGDELARVRNEDDIDRVIVQQLAIAKP